MLFLRYAKLPIYDSVVFRKSKNSRFRIALLSNRGDRANLNEPESDFVQSLESLAVFIESSCTSDRVFECFVECLHALFEFRPNKLIDLIKLERR